MESSTKEEVIDGVATKLHVTLYQNRVLVVISQTQTFGSIMLARGEAGFQQLGVADVKVLLGKRDNAASLACAQKLVLELMQLGCTRHKGELSQVKAYGSQPCRPLLLCLALKHQTLPTVKAAITAIVNQPIWQQFQPQHQL